MGNISVVGFFRANDHYFLGLVKILGKSLTKGYQKTLQTRMTELLCYRSIATVSFQSFQYNNVAILVIRSYH